MAEIWGTLHYERNEITPSVEVAAKIADALDVSLDY
jgi:transcriptional regulator with XRE-family HTH domain